MKIGFIGCGRIADLHARAYRDQSKACLYAVCDSDSEKLRARQRDWNAEKGYEDYRDLLADPEITAVEILCPYDIHEEVVIAAARAGKHIACQKPMTTSLHSARRMAEAVQKAGVHFQLTEIYVHYPPIAFAKKLIDDGAIGEPVGMRIDFVSSPLGGWFVPPSTYEQQTRIAGKGFGLSTFDHGHHEWATAWYLLGAAERVSAWIDSNDGMLDVPATIMWKCKGNKRYGICEFLFASSMPVPTKYYSNDELYRIVGTKGILHINRGTGDMMEGPSVSLFKDGAWTHYHDIPTDWGLGFVNAGRHFFDVLSGDAPPLLSLEQGAEVLRFGLAIMESARKRREVYLDEVERPAALLSNISRRMRERSESVVAPRTARFPWFHRDVSRFAPEAERLTENLASQFDGAAVPEWNAVIALELLDSKGHASQTYTFHFKQGTLNIEKGVLAQDALLTVHLEAGLWAAILMKKRRIELAVIQGKIKFEGRGEEALYLKKAFHF
ncbi:MAG: Glucose--fructose oxidoreductase precursor [Candidatus Hydrogenedentes bacterium ADurb.Bin101]|jgi:predicted dehydrogenase|nr:MAG: Glucose--fructose oxidoreductase precursor [Candidatus Hydrogenedentes bacterium ADurb.Bin101]HOC70066.1 Gfo/Idh/MocA family oxidoreductase [Candidatus Hydrogenedentota bacterium]